MEILNNIWMAVSTPNESLINIIAIPAVIIENFLIMSLFISILHISANRYKKIAYVLTLSAIGIFTMYFIPNPFNIFINYFASVAIAYFVFKNSLLKTTISAIIDLTIFNLIGKLIIFSNLFFGILAIIIQSITLFYYVDTLPNIITFLSFISLLAYFAISIYSLTRVFKLILTTRKLESAEAYNNTLRILHDNVRGFKHDFDNIVTTIGGYIKTNDMEGLKNYYSQLEDDCQRVNNLYILNPDIVNNDGIYNLLTKKYYEAEREDIKVNITFLLDLSTLHMKIYEFARILGILLDNAIEASSESTEKIINLSFRDDFRNSRQLITIENTYSNKDVNTDIIFEKGVSGKDDHTGLGLWEVRKLIKKNNNINLFTTKDDKFFKQQLEIYY